jgi:hypothetical protein
LDSKEPEPEPGEGSSAVSETKKKMETLSLFAEEDESLKTQNPDTQGESATPICALCDEPCVCI